MFERPERFRFMPALRLSAGPVCLLVPALLVPAVGLALMQSSVGEPDLAARYAQATPENAISQLQGRIDRGEVTLAYDPQRGYLPATLAALQIPVSSQTLVFSKTSVQKDLISPQTPRALYFNDSVYIGYVPHGKSLEVATADPKWGAVYYVLLQRETAKPRFFRSVAPCLECHASSTGQHLPQHLMRSVYPDREGMPDPDAPTFQTTEMSPLTERWGGWYVTGRHGNQRHMGNAIATREGGVIRLDREQGANVTDLRRYCDTSPYLSPHSDIVALMALEHQTHLQNLIAMTHDEVDLALSSGRTNTDREYITNKNNKKEYKNKKANQDTESPGNGLQTQIRAACEPLVRALLFVREAPLTAPVSGTSGFEAQFAARGPRDHRGRSLRQLDLKHRLLRYPCSYTIYSPAFDGLPAAAKTVIFRRLWEVLSGRDHGPEFVHLSPADRKAVLAILRDTKPDFAAQTGAQR